MNTFYHFGLLILFVYCAVFGEEKSSGIFEEDVPIANLIQRDKKETLVQSVHETDANKVAQEEGVNTIICHF